MKKTLLAILCIFHVSLYCLYGQTTYFNKDYSFAPELSLGTCVYPQTNSYFVISNNYYNNKWHFLVSSTNLEGDTSYIKKYKHPFYTWGIATKSITKTKDGNFVACGLICLDTINNSCDSARVLLVKLNDLCDTLWTKQYMSYPNKRSGGISIYQEADSGFVIIGYTNKLPNKGYDIFLLRTDSLGNVLWEKNYGSGSDESCYSIVKAPDGGYLIGGDTWGYGSGMSDILVIKVDSLGNFQWQKTFGYTKKDGGGYLTTLPQGGYLLSGGVTPNNMVWPNGYVARLDDSGNKIWEKDFGNINNNTLGIAPILSSNNTFIVVGAYRDTINVNAVNAWFVKFDLNGNLLWERLYNKYGGNNQNYIEDAKPTPDGGYIACGWVTILPAQGQNLWLLKLDSMGCDIANCSVGMEEEMPNEFVFTLYPNPAQDVLHIETTYNKEQTILYIYDITGKEIRQTSIESNYQQVDISTLPPGIYLCRLLQNGNILARDKLIKLQ
ncbi:MAG: hypothetical protein HJHJAOHD_01961 [Flavobacteriales bacterium]|nr:hypothetical protein [Flavobacteriales bacterium]MCL4816679.1 T9SS type A sorting domain-containing protein [Flavobacteriales bacterium]WKZ75941.1 MAG: T9SS type A sorting domain-containing protein [Vicingaceae bacterium]